MDNFKVIYKILKILEKAMDLEEFDKESISADNLKISYARWCRIMLNDPPKMVHRSTLNSGYPMCDSCKRVLEQYKEKNTNVEIHVIERRGNRGGQT